MFRNRSSVSVILTACALFIPPPNPSVPFSQEEADRFVEDTKGRLTTTTDKGALADCDLVIEAILENVDAKQSLFREPGTIVQPHGLLATNTSSLPVSKVSEVSGRPDRVVREHCGKPATQIAGLDGDETIRNFFCVCVLRLNTGGVAFLQSRPNDEAGGGAWSCQ